SPASSTRGRRSPRSGRSTPRSSWTWSRPRPPEPCVQVKHRSPSTPPATTKAAPPCPSTRAAVSKGSARACELSPPPRTTPADPKGWTEGPPNVQEEGGFRKGGPAPPCTADPKGWTEGPPNV